MNIQESDILNLIITNTYTNQRKLAEVSGHSLGIVNRSIRQLISEGYLDESIHPTEKAISEIQESAPKRAIILAAGFGMRMVPIIELPPDEWETVVNSSFRLTRTELSLSTRSLTIYQE